ncbi:MAG: nuclear transport factor 2 family protein [Dehalococcoidia bacterium]|nr:MAG: nuclear transport factor 2 family protein [Dehalococcoidia bacterium]
MDLEHPARAASKRSASAAERGAREEWLSLFTDDAIVEDPVGVSPLDPDGKGHVGKAAIAAFWDRNIGSNKIEFDIHHSYAAGSEVANTGTIISTLPNGMKAVIDGTFVYKVDADGKIVSLRAFWEFENMRLIGP